MKRKRINIERSSRVRRQRDPIPWKYCVLTVVCGLLLVAGFFVAAKQHFTSVQTGMGNAELRGTVAKLKDENRRLLISKERASTPAKIAKLARDYGFTETPRSVISATPVYQNASSLSSPATESNPQPEQVAIEPPIQKNPDNKQAPKPVLAAKTKKLKISDDQIAALRVKEN